MAGAHAEGQLLSGSNFLLLLTLFKLPSQWSMFMRMNKNNRDTFGSDSYPSGLEIQYMILEIKSTL